MKKYSKKIIITLIVLISIAAFIWFIGGMIAPGSYVYAEIYEFNLSEDSLITIIKEFKKENQDYNVPALAQLTDEKEYYWTFFYFYYSDKNQIVCTWTRSGGKNKTNFALISINDGLQLGHWKTVNKDYGFFENRKVKKEFEERILKKLKEKTGEDL